MKKKLCMIFGGPERRLQKRINSSLLNCSFEQHDFLFVGNDEECHLLRGKLAIGNECCIPFIYSWNTKTNIQNSEKIWRNYDEIVIFSGKYHLKRIEFFFEMYANFPKLILKDSGETEKWNAPILYILYKNRWISKYISSLSDLIFNKLKKYSW